MGGQGGLKKLQIGYKERTKKYPLGCRVYPRGEVFLGSLFLSAALRFRWPYLMGIIRDSYSSLV